MKKHKILAAMLACVMLVMAFPASGSATTFSDVTSDSIKDKENQISQAEDEKEKLQGMLTDIKKIKEQLEGQKSNLKTYVAELDKNLTAIQEKIAELEAMITEKQKEIETTQAELDAALITEENQYESMKTRIQMMYEQGDTYYMDLLFGGNGFADMLNRLDYVEQLSRYDQEKLNEYVMNRELIEYCKMQLDAEKAVLDEAKVGVEAEKAALETLIEEKKNKLTEFENDIKNKQQAIREYEEDIAAQTQLIEDLEAAVLEERKQILEQNGLVLEYDGGAFKFPLAKYTKMTSDYGMRRHPILGVNQFHNGVDLASPMGTAIYAAYDGVVVAAAYNASMGNYVMINHGGGLYTVYMHASKLYVSKDDIVARGETIAAVGSTGRSTGPHLHFSVRLNGEYVSPWNYISL